MLCMSKISISWDQFTIPTAASWVVKFVCKVKNYFSDQIGYQWLQSAKYSIKGTYTQLRCLGTKVPWQKYVWNRLTIPKHRFIMWLAMLDRLKTKDRLFKVGISTGDSCPICGAQVEKVEHLFFECELSRQCKLLVFSWLGVQLNRVTVFSLLMGVQKYSRSKYRRFIIITAVASLVYNIWRARNAAIWSLHIPIVQSIVKTIQAEVKGRVMNLLNSKTSSRDLDWFHSL
ncbi:uncharacterized protein [Spinacia oleracea]|uniref:Reverse transcriptase zinc-binding domain-containing protein n=1 Tax=Spinacia oleracea TaxID=3562 RepID=A0A9R0JXR3_SPIOL|nr:uncharacterized protein LOC110790536 [Spinacia oleracea]